MLALGPGVCHVSYPAHKLSYVLMTTMGMPLGRDMAGDSVWREGCKVGASKAQSRRVFSVVDKRGLRARQRFVLSRSVSAQRVIDVLVLLAGWASSLFTDR